jgi:hypothetical protein
LKASPRTINFSCQINHGTSDIKSIQWTGEYFHLTKSRLRRLLRRWLPTPLVDLNVKVTQIRWIHVREYISWEDSVERNLGSFVVGSELQRLVILKNNQGTINAISKSWRAGKHHDA